MRNHNMDQLISSPTCVTVTTSTTIDHIWCNNPTQYSHRGTLELGLSDHSLVFICRKKVKPSKVKERIFIRNYRTFNPASFAEDVRDCDWSDVYNAPTLEEAVSMFNFVLAEIINNNLPWKMIRTRVSTAPWVNSEFLSAIDTREY